MASATRAYGWPGRRAARDEAAELTPREADILRLVCGGAIEDAAAATPRKLN